MDRTHATSSRAAGSKDESVIPALTFLARRIKAILDSAGAIVVPSAVTAINEGREALIQKRLKREAMLLVFVSTGALPGVPAQRQPNRSAHSAPAHNARTMQIWWRHGEVMYWVPGFMPTPYLHDTLRQLEQAA